jgi:catechol 2,3-dioxygenase-like lactoylglutathione lyase family enzyme
MIVRIFLALCLAAPSVSGAVESSLPEPGGHITGVGGIFFKAKDPKTLAAWYRDILGLPLQSWGGAALRYDAPQHPPAVIWNVLPESTKYLEPSATGFMLNYAVDDMDAFIARLGAKGVTPLKRADDATGRFAWIVDPEGNKIELWQPKSTATH